MNSPLLLIVLLWSVLAYAMWIAFRASMSRRKVLERINALEPPPEEPASDNFLSGGRLARWLFLAGFRETGATRTFIVTSVVLLVAGLLVAYLLQASGLTEAGLRLTSRIPGGMGDLGLPFVYLAPWVTAAVVAGLPWLAVHSARERRKQSIGQDLPLALELLATLSEAGLSFDQALAHVLDSQTEVRPLAEELRGLQADILASRPRIECFRRLARRVQLASFSVFISAVVQAEQIGAGVAVVLRRQADDLRQRRREEAMALAMALPVKRLFPMVICFMPGIFLVTLGPAIHEFLKFAQGFLDSR
jgi:tight adherence protein C